MPADKLTVEDLLSFPALQLSVKAGISGLGRSVSWAHVSELDDPTPWLLGAEILMTTGLGIPRTAAGQRRYLERLDDAGVSALALSAQLHMPVLHEAFFLAAEERGFPVLEVPLAVPFIAVSQEVAAAVQEDARHRLGAQLQVFGSLRWMVAEDLDTPTLLRRLERLSGYDVYLCTPQGRPLLPGVPTPGPGCCPPRWTPRRPSPAVSSCRCRRPAARRASWWRTSGRAPSPPASRWSSTSRRWRHCGWRWCAANARRCAARSRDAGRAAPGGARPGSRPPQAGPALHRGRHRPDRGPAHPDEALLACLEDHSHLLLTWGEDRYVLGAPELADTIGALPAVTAGMSRPSGRARP